jgi:hypothetical protein
VNVPKWAAVAATAFFALMNFGVVLDSSQEGMLRLVALLLTAGGVGGALGLAIGKTWGKAAVVLIGLVNVALVVLEMRDVIDGGYTGVDGYWGIALGVVGVLLGLAA